MLQGPTFSEASEGPAFAEASEGPTFAEATQGWSLISLEEGSTLHINQERKMYLRKALKNASKELLSRDVVTGRE